jgi:cytoskeletal protein RodZ
VPKEEAVKEISPKVAGLIIGGLVVAAGLTLGILGYIDDRQAREREVTATSPPATTYSSQPATTYPAPATVAPTTEDTSTSEGSDSGYSAAPKTREESQELGRSFAAYLSDPDECADSYETENLEDLGVDWSAFVAACQGEVIWNG